MSSRRRRNLLTTTVAAVVALTSTIGSPAVAASGSVAPTHSEAVQRQTADNVAVSRVFGDDRYDTAVRLSASLTAPVPVVFVATGLDFPDALAAAAAAGALGGPLLLTRPTALPSAVRDEIVRLKPARIVVVGGTSVVSERVKHALNAISPTTRSDGGNRYDTAVRLSRSEFDSADEVVVATGRDFPDALVAAAAAGGSKLPVLLVNGKAKTVPAALVREIARLQARRVSIIGGYGAVSAEIQAVLASKEGLEVARYAGANRYDTASTVNDAYFAAGSADAAFIATGTDFPDALAGAAQAARLQQPLFVAPRTCAPPSIVASASNIGVISTLALGGKAVLGDVSAGLASCTPADRGRVLDQTWDEVRMTLDAAAPAPYTDRPPVDVRAATQAVDATGLRIYQIRRTTTRADHPVVYAQYGISALIEYQRTGESMWLQRAVRQAERIIEMRTLRGEAWWFGYPFDWTYIDRTLRAPWWSAMAQGQALSLFTRLAEVHPEARWDAAVAGTWQSFLQARSSTQQWSNAVIDGRLYFEEYAGGQKPLQVLNGQIFAMFGVYDYWRQSGDPDAARLLQGAGATVLSMMPRIRKPGDVSYYCVQPVFCQQPSWQNKKYHEIHSWQLDTLAQLTGDTAFSDWAALLRQDWRAPEGRLRSLDSTGSQRPLEADPLDAGQDGLLP